jgi:hypothetical protein
VTAEVDPWAKIERRERESSDGPITPSQKSFKLRWTDAALDAQLGTTYFGVLMAFAVYASADGGNVFPGDEKIAAHLGVTDRTIRPWRQKAITDGWLVVEAKHHRPAGKATRMRLAIPPEVERSGTGS